MSLLSTPTAAPCTKAMSWSQQLSCGWHQPANTTAGHIGFEFGYYLIPALLIGAVILFVIIGALKKKTVRTARRATAGGR